jgi:hypothetical protein
MRVKLHRLASPQMVAAASASPFRQGQANESLMSERETDASACLRRHHHVLTKACARGRVVLSISTLPSQPSSVRDNHLAVGEWKRSRGTLP